MAGKNVVHDYPPDDDLVALVREHGSVVAAAAALGISDKALHTYVNKQGLKERCAQARREHTASKRVVRAEQPVTDPTRVKADQDAALIRALKKENHEYAKVLANQEAFYDRIIEASRVPVEVAKYKVARRPGHRPRRSVVVPIYDQQYGQLVRRSDTMGGKGSYDTSIYDQRQTRWLDGVTGNIRDYADSHDLDELVIVMGGDHVEGEDIFAGQAWQLQIDPCRQVVELKEKLTAAITELVKFAKEEIGIPHIAIYGVDDNHGKVGGKRKGATPSTFSWNWLLMEWLKDRLAGQPIDEFATEPAGAIFFYAAGLEFQAVHGHHNIKGWGGIPYYGIQRYDAKSVRMHNRIFRYLLMGHIHTPAEITVGTGAEAIVSGDWVGANNLSGDIAAASRPQQKVLYVANKWGITETARIYLTDAEEAHQPTHIYGRPA